VIRNEFMKLVNDLEQRLQSVEVTLTTLNTANLAEKLSSL